MDKITLPEHFNYIGVFLTFDCQYSCAYCINHHNGRIRDYPVMTAEQWVEGLERLPASETLPITLQGGEPTLYKDFFRVVRAVRKPMDLLTNFDIGMLDFIEHIPAWKFKREAKYASIRVSYHPSQADFMVLLRKVWYMKAHGYDIGIWEIDHPDYPEKIALRKQVATAWGIDYRLKDFLGPWKGEYYGNFAFAGSVNSNPIRSCTCRTSEILIAPDGNIFRCHSDLYNIRNPIAHILDERVELGKWLPCMHYGQCNACDVKVKTNRFQEYGHSSVEVRL